MKKFIMFSDARCGGTHVIAKLNSHPEIHAVGEPFPHLSLNTHSQQLHWTRKFFESDNHVKAKGFRTKIEQVEELNKFLELINNSEITPFILKRKNLVKKAISRINAVHLFKETQDYNLKINPSQSRRFIIDPDVLKREMTFCLKQNALTDRLTEKLKYCVIIFYEDILSNEEKFFDFIITEILNLPKMPLQTSVYKYTQDNLKDCIINYEEIKRHLFGTKYLEDFLMRTDN